MSGDRGREVCDKCICVGLALMLVVIGSNFVMAASSSSPLQTISAVKSPAFLEYVILENNSRNIVFSGLLVDGLNQKPIVNATINIVDSRNLTVYGQATTNESGGFAFNFPLNYAHLSIKAVFLGDSQHKESVSDTVNIIISSTPTPTPTVPEFPTTIVSTVLLFAATIVTLFCKKNLRKSKEKERFCG
jgi:hypothetical protein